MKQILKKIIGIVTLLVIILIVLLAYFGLFTTIKVAEKDVGPYHLVYYFHEGNYRKSGEIMDRIYHKLIGEDSIKTELGFGIYYDNPKNVPVEKCRSLVGCILKKDDAYKMKLLARKYCVAEIPASRSYIVEFPFRGFPSIILGIIKAYPVLDESLKQAKKECPARMEIYDSNAGKIFYLAPTGPGKKFFEDLLSNSKIKWEG
ncbi:hypothetical protein ACFL35_14035 [Candidatus Riflebacteria bacterium]